ncbi:hypothetical protein EXIGLDRAFT_760837 [Exidia glandulosa HHB12029]|uniref:F-box domain-containing protein n=1 Tax=Exidia glandulosa HHB12029 TaxID=1314781 RepID=A0A165NWZ3_EXIGL|nr:hypothetical protein EXIGLDRAFT_760837 [Exidia glandulosa HHB12029]
MSPSLVDLNFDVLVYMCNELHTSQDGRKSLNALSLTSHQMRAAALPRLFRTMHVGGSLRKCTESMRGLLATATPAQNVRSFTVYLSGLRDYSYGDEQASAIAEAQLPEDATAFSAMLVDLLNAAEGLQHFALVVGPKIYPRSAATFISSTLNPTLSASRLHLPNMASLVLPSSCTALAEACPSVVHLQLDVWGQRDTSELEVDMEAQIWGTQVDVASLQVTIRLTRDLKFVQAMTESMHHLTSLDIRARMRFSEQISCLSHLRRIHTLTLRQYEFPGSCTLGRRRHDSEQLMAAIRTETKETKRSARRFLPQLRTLRIGETVYNLSKLQTHSLDELDALEAET